MRLNLKKDQQLEIEWEDGARSVYPLNLLRAMCPCALCKTLREQQAEQQKEAGPKRSLTVLGAAPAGPLRVVHAELVGNYALQLDWSDDHSSGIYSFTYLRSISPESPVQKD